MRSLTHIVSVCSIFVIVMGEDGKKWEGMGGNGMDVREQVRILTSLCHSTKLAKREGGSRYDVRKGGKVEV